MKKLLVSMTLVLLTVVASNQKVQAQDPISIIIKEAVTKVIKAVDLKIQRLQNKTIWLQNAQKTIENTMSKLKLDQISEWVEKQRALYKDYFDELYKVKDAVAYYHRIKDITEKQIALVKEYRKAYNGIKEDHHFTDEEVVYIGKVYTGIIEESVKNLDGIGMVINSFTTSMSDAKRLELIDHAAEDLQQNYDDLKAFNSQNIRLSLQRSKDARDIAFVKSLYGLQ